MNVYTVTELNLIIKQCLDAVPELNGAFVRGEISNCKQYPSGHWYFSLKDEGGAIRCVMFRREASSLRFRPENGMSVIAEGRVSVYPRDGQYQFYCSRMQPDGVGALHIAYEQLVRKLGFTVHNHRFRKCDRLRTSYEAGMCRRVYFPKQILQLPFCIVLYRGHRVHVP